MAACSAEGEVIRPGAFAKAIAKWRDSGRDLPVYWDHRAGAESVIGSVDASTVRETDDGLYVAGNLGLEDSPLAREAWRSVKRNRIGLSFGYLVTADHDRPDGVKELLAIDPFEITLTPAPANSDTRILSTESTRTKRYLDPKSGNRMNYAELVEHAAAMEQKSAPVKVASFEC
jgi:HK97 family phage prohead protease